MDTTDDNAKPRRDVSTDGDQPIRLAGSILGAQRHVCAFFHSADEEYRGMLPFIEHGFECGDRAFHVVDPKRREEHRRRLEAAGIDVVATRESIHATVSRNRRRWQVSDRDKLTVSVPFSHPVQ